MLKFVMIILMCISSTLIQAQSGNKGLVNESKTPEQSKEESELKRNEIERGRKQVESGILYKRRFKQLVAELGYDSSFADVRFIDVIDSDKYQFNNEGDVESSDQWLGFLETNEVICKSDVTFEVFVEFGIDSMLGKVKCIKLPSRVRPRPYKDLAVKFNAFEKEYPENIITF